MAVAVDQKVYAGSLACGAWLVVTGPAGRTVTARVVDDCHECSPGSLRLSERAFARLASLDAGQVAVSWRWASPALSGPVAYRYAAGSNTYWCGIQVRNHRNPVQSLAVQVGTGWQALQRRDYNFFESPTGAGCGNAIRIADIFGHQLTDVGITIRPGVVQAGHAQFGPPA